MISPMRINAFRSGNCTYKLIYKVLNIQNAKSLSCLSIINPGLKTPGSVDESSKAIPIQSFRNAASTPFAPDGTPSKRKIGVQGATLDKGQPKIGVADGPTTCRKSGFIEILRDSVKLDVKDYGDIPLGVTSQSSDPTEEASPDDVEGVKRAKHVTQVARAAKAISDATVRVIQDGRICLTLGGDHSLGIGTVHGSSEVYNDLAVLWVDAHADINTINSSGSGNIHGMSVAFLIEELQPYMDQLPQFSWVTPRIKAKNIAYIGLRDVDNAERAILDLLGITAFSMKDVDRFGIRKVTQMALESIAPGNKRPLHLSFDIDSLDDTEVACTGTKVPGGLTLREGLVILEEINDAGNMISMDLVEVNPQLGNEQQMSRTIQVVKHLLTNAFGYNRGGVTGGRKLTPIIAKS